jgi:hypothetical protein
VFAQSFISAPNIRLGTQLHANAGAMCLLFAQITSTGIGRNAVACANGLKCARLATSGTKSLVPAYAHLNHALMATIGTTNYASAFASHRYAQ